MERHKLHLTVGWIGMALYAAGAAWFAVLAGLLKTTKTPRLYDLVDMYSLFVIVCLVWGFIAWRSFASSWGGYRRPLQAEGTEEAGRSAQRKGWMAALVLNGLYVAVDLAIVVFLVYAFWKATKGS
ncbi:hypothetical protein [Cohnella zeiphila]|uniref:Uncharacterized protein n=1 Tax=Cohnella zeiphila TaxID=2761120 RepID=A0A7X0VW05_9BACL|nr:hypothetical protein [Cohnella zeiphila]MBB6730448.1 hypothetical protein [Cohnella zeiphila]